jgi:hypothetical protein
VLTAGTLVSTATGCAKKMMCPATESIGGDFDISYADVSKDCLSAQGLELPPRVITPVANTLPILNYFTSHTSGEAQSHDCEVDVLIQRLYDSEWLLSIGGEQLVEDVDGKLHGPVTIEVRAGHSTDSLPVCTALSSITLTPRVADAGFP